MGTVRAGMKWGYSKGNRDSSTGATYRPNPFAARAVRRKPIPLMPASARR